MEKCVLNKYIILENDVLGKNEYSIVYLGTHKILGNKIAIKVYNKAKLSTDIGRCVIEELNIINILIKNKFEYIVDIYDSYVNEQYMYIIMEYCDSDLKTLIETEDFTEQKAKEYYRQIIEGLLFLQDFKIIHRDLKPENILIKNNIIKIADFGFSKIVTNELNKTICGTPMYMSPELFEFKTYNENIDVWSSGLILYEMIYSINPFKQCNNFEELLESIKDKEILFPHLNKYKIQISINCIKLLKKLLQKNDKKRILLIDILNDKWFSNDINITQSLPPNTISILPMEHKIPYSSSAPTTTYWKYLKKYLPKSNYVYDTF